MPVVWPTEGTFFAAELIQSTKTARFTQPIAGRRLWIYPAKGMASFIEIAFREF